MSGRASSESAEAALIALPDPWACSYCKAGQAACEAAPDACCIRCSDAPDGTHWADPAPAPIGPYEDALHVARSLLAVANEADPGMSAATHYSSNPKTAAKQRATNDHYAAYGLRTAVFAIFPELEAEADAEQPKASTDAHEKANSATEGP